jgi:hypothetical protein
MVKNKYLICVSNLKNCSAALKYAALKAKKDKALIEILSVIDTVNKGYGLFSIDKIMDKENRKNQEETLNEISNFIKKISNIVPVINIKEGIISDEISKVLEKDKSINLVILSSCEESSSKGKLISHIAELSAVKIFTPITIIPNSLSEEEIKKII